MWQTNPSLFSGFPIAFFFGNLLVLWVEHPCALFYILFLPMKKKQVFNIFATKSYNILIFLYCFLIFKFYFSKIKIHKTHKYIVTIFSTTTSSSFSNQQQLRFLSLTNNNFIFFPSIYRTTHIHLFQSSCKTTTN